MDLAQLPRSLRAAEETVEITTQLELAAMSLEVPETPGHPNKRPFSGVLTRIDKPSDGPPGGSGGRLVMLTKACAERSLATLLGMAIDCSADLSDHAESNKIGVITEANIDGDAIVIAGHFFAKDFPTTMREIDRQKSKLGFSYELTPSKAVISTDNLLVIEDGVFTGAALLFKSKAAYKTTSLAASDTQEKSEMELKDLIESVAKLTAATEAQGKQLASLADKVEKGLKATDVKSSVECRELVEPHAMALEKSADHMKAAGIGMHAGHGHVAVLHKMAAHMRAAAALGQVPHIFRDHDYPFTASDTGDKTTKLDDETKKVLGELQAAQKTTAEAMAAITTQLKDLTAKQRDDKNPPERKTLPAHVTSLLARHGVTSPEADKDGKFDTNAISAALQKAGVAAEERMVVINTLDRIQRGMAA